MYSMDPKKLVEKGKTETGGVLYIAEPAKIYPAAVAELQAAAKKNRSDYPYTFNTVLLKASKIPEKAWKLALKPISKTAAADVELRAEALELARVWFQNRLKLEISEDFLHWRIENDPEFALTK